MPADVLEIARPTSGGFDATTIREFAMLEMVEAALFRIGREHSSFCWNDLRVTRGEHVRLPQDAARLPGGLAEVATGDAAEYKRWIGFDDAAIRNGMAVATPVDWTRLGNPAALDVDALSPPQARSLETAATAYFFGDSREVAAFKPVLERHYAPFRAQVIVASRVVLEPDAELHITGIPTVVIVEEFVFNGGRLFVSPVSHFNIGFAAGRPAGL